MQKVPLKKGLEEQAVQQILQDDSKEAANHEEVLEVGRMRADDVRRLVEYVICNFNL